MNELETEIRAYLEKLKSLAHIPDYRITTLPDGSISVEVPAMYSLSEGQLAELSILIRGRAALGWASVNILTRLDAAIDPGQQEAPGG